MTTDPIQITISDAGQSFVCQTYKNGPRVTTTPGSLIVGPLATIGATTINLPSTVIVSVTPSEFLSANCQLQIRLAPEFTIFETAA